MELAKSGRTLADVHRNIQHSAARHPDQLALGMRRGLEMQAAQGPHFGGEGMVILHKVNIQPSGGQRVAVIGF